MSKKWMVQALGVGNSSLEIEADEETDAVSQYWFSRAGSVYTRMKARQTSDDVQLHEAAYEVLAEDGIGTGFRQLPLTLLRRIWEQPTTPNTGGREIVQK